MERFKFQNPGLVKILAGRFKGQQLTFDISNEKWEWIDGGIKCSLDWNSFNIQAELKEILKGFIHFRLQTVAPLTVYSMDVRFLTFIAGNRISETFPWYPSELLKLTNELQKHNSKNYYSFKALVSWGIKRKISGFDKSMLVLISENKPIRKKQYESIYLRQNIITPSDEIRILGHIERNENNPVFTEFRDGIILHLAYELAPRPIQIHTINRKDFNIYKSTTESFYSINLPMAKKMRSAIPEKRFRSISSILGSKIERLIECSKTIEVTQVSDPLFTDDQGYRLSATEISSIILSQLKLLGFREGQGSILLRHHLGQSLADQGAPAEVIAEILGHNSTVPARAYVGATPEIAAIKTRALGKIDTYINIMKMLVTGEIIERASSPKERWVKGVVGSQYIGGIGSCGLSSSTSCPKNPVYSCYTCSKFHPFIDGSHVEVKTALETQSQYFIDIAEKGIQIEGNRPLTQLELTIQAVNVVLEKCQDISKQNND
jgi:integrase